MLKFYVSARTYLTGLLNRDDRGATAVEYALLVFFIALVMVVGATFLGKQLSALFTTIGSDI